MIKVYSTVHSENEAKYVKEVFDYAENSKVVDLVLQDLSYSLVPKWLLDFAIWRHEQGDTDLWRAQTS